MSLLARRRSTAAAEGPSEDEIYGGSEPMDAAPDEAPTTGGVPADETTSAGTSAPDEFDIAAEVVTGVKSDDAPDGEKNEGEDASPEPAEPSNPEEDAEKTRDQEILDEYQRRTGASPEAAQAWLAAAKAAKPQQNPSEQQEQEKKAPPPRMGPPSALGTLFSGIGGLGGGALRGLKNTALSGTNAALRGTGLRASAGLTPEVVKERLFSKWHEDYEIGKRGMNRSTDDIIKAAAAYNQLIRTGAPGRELEKIAKSQGTDIKTLISDVTAGKIQDNDAKVAVDALRTDPHVQKAWGKFSESVKAFGDHRDAVQHNLTQLANNGSNKVDLNIEQAALGEIFNKHGKVEQPFELPANPIADGKADGKSPQKSMWDQFMEMSQNGLSFLQQLMDRVATFVAQKFGR